MKTTTKKKQNIKPLMRTKTKRKDYRETKKKKQF